MNKVSRQPDYVFDPNHYPITPGLRLIEASAGTGKTFALAHIVLRLLTEGKQSLRQLLVVTFTDASAAELRARIGLRLEAALDGLEALAGGNVPKANDPVLQEWLEQTGLEQQQRKTEQQINAQRQQWICQLLEALEGLDQADITTIHGFCRRTLRRQALESGSVMEPILEGDAQQLVLEVIHDYWQQQILELDPQDVRGLQAAGLDVEALTKGLLKVDNEPSLTFKTDDHDLEPTQALKDQFGDCLLNRWRPFVEQWQQEGLALEAEFCRTAADWRSRGCKASETKPFTPKPKTNRCELLTDWIDHVQLTEHDLGHGSAPAYGLIRDQDLLKDYFHPQVFCKAARSCGEDTPTPLSPQLQTAIADLWDGPAQRVWCHALQWGRQALKERRQKRGVMSYAELLAALDPGTDHETKSERITSSPWLQSLRERYQVALIDEFQDTDPVQWRLLNQTFGRSPDHLLVMVGDPKQAIYQFRGGDLNTYMKARLEVDRIDALLDNFRTTAPLMDGLNQLMAAGLKRSQLDVPALRSRSNSKPLQLAQSNQPLQLLNLDDESSDDDSRDDESREADSHDADSRDNDSRDADSHDNDSRDEDKLVKDRLNKDSRNKNSLDEDNASTKVKSQVLLSKTKLEDLVPKSVAAAVLELLHQQPEDLQPTDICILVSRHLQASRIRESLASVGLPSRLVSQGDVLTSEAALVLQRFLDCLAKPAHTGNLRLVACSALLQWNKEQLQHCENNGELDQLALRFQKWALKLPKLGLLGCLSELLKGRTMADLSERGRLLGDLQQCAQLVQEAIHQQGLDAPTAAAWLRRQRLQPVDSVPESRQPHSDVAESAVAVVTVHRSKGLEYPVVICPYLWQAPSQPEGPLFRCEADPYWNLVLSTNWGEGWQVSERARQASLQEAERLAYVAVTRACSLLILVWARAAKQEGNPLTNWLFGPDAIDAAMQELTPQRMQTWLNNQNINISVLAHQATEPQQHWRAAPPVGDLSLGAIPQRRLDLSWGRSSYSSWVANAQHHGGSAPADPMELEEGRDTDQQIQESLPSDQADGPRPTAVVNPAESTWPEQSPLGTFPRGAEAGDCLHRILERLNFNEPLTTNAAASTIEEELRRTGLDPGLLMSVQDGLTNVLNTPMGGDLGSLCLNQLDQRRRIHELSFDLPVAHSGGAVDALAIAKVFELDSWARFATPYCEKIAALDIYSRGFLTGSIDLVFNDSEDLSKARWWVADWKSNWIGQRDQEGQIISCGPIDYNNEAMEQQMLHHHYPLQAHLYLVALHRYLTWRLPNYDPNRHLGGYAYVFLRGLPGEQAMENDSLREPIPGLIVEPAPLKRILQLDRLLMKGRQ